MSYIKKFFSNYSVKTRFFLNILVISFALVTFFYVAQKVQNGSTTNFDYSILNSLRGDNPTSEPLGSNWLTILMTDITALGGATIIFFITALVVIYLLLKKNYFFLWLILIATIGGVIISLGLKEFFSRERPPIEYHLITVKSLSFPSGHATMASVVYLTQGVLFAKLHTVKKIKIFVLAVSVFLVVLIGISRIYLGVHYPTDVIAGWAVGTAWASSCWLVAKNFQKRYEEKFFDETKI